MLPQSSRPTSRWRGPLHYAQLVDSPLSVEVWGEHNQPAFWLVRDPAGWFRVPTGPGTWRNREAVDPPTLANARRYSDQTARAVLTSIGYPLP